MNTITILLAALTLASTLGAASAVFYGVRQKTIIEVLRLSNDSYKERNEQLESIIKERDAKYAKDIAELQGKVSVLENIKTPPLEPMMKQMNTNHKEVMKVLVKGNAA